MSVTPIYVFLGGKSPKYLDLTAQALKFAIRNIKNGTIGVVSPPDSGDLKDSLEKKIHELDDSLDVGDIKYIEGQKHFDNWNNTQHILDIEPFTEEFDPIVFLDSTTVILQDVSPFIEKFVSSGKKFAFYRDFVNDYPNFKQFLDVELVPQMSLLVFRSAHFAPLIQIWQDNWKEWIDPAPFVNHKDPARFYAQSRLSIGQYSLAQSVKKYVKNYKNEVTEITRADLKIFRNLGIDAQRVRQKFLSAGSSYSNEGVIKITLTVQRGKVYEKQDLGRNVGDPYVTVKVGDWERRTATIDNTQEPVFNEEFVFDEMTYWDAANVTVTLWDSDKVTKDDQIGSADLNLLPIKSLIATDNAPTPTPTHYQIGMIDKDGKEQGVVEIDALFCVTVVEEGEGETKTRDLGGATQTQAQVASEKPPLTKERSVPSLPKGEPYTGEAKVTITLISGKVYEKHDLIGQDDPYVKIKIGALAERKSKTVKSNQNPVWNETLVFDKVKSQDAENVTLTIWDEDTVSKDDYIGTAQLSLLPYRNNKQHVTLPFTDNKNIEQAKVELDIVLEFPLPPSVSPTPATTVAAAPSQRAAASPSASPPATAAKAAAPPPPALKSYPSTSSQSSQPKTPTKEANPKTPAPAKKKFFFF